MTETHQRDADPNGKAPHEAGAKLDAHKPRMGLVLGDFARALSAVGDVGTYGAQKYSDHGWTQVDDGVARYTDAMYRHLLAEESEGPIDQESGLMHAAMAAWNALARLDLMLRNLDLSASMSQFDSSGDLVQRMLFGAKVLLRETGDDPVALDMCRRDLTRAWDAITSRLKEELSHE